MSYYFIRTIFLLLIVYNPAIESRISTFKELDELIAKAAIGGELIDGVIKLDLPDEGRIAQGGEAIVWKGNDYKVQ